MSQRSWRTLTLLSGALALGLAACTPGAAPTKADDKSSAAAGACADGGAKLTTVGLCQADAAKLLQIGDGAEPTLPAGCTWVVQETALDGGEKALLYRAASCKGVTTTLAAAVGAKSTSFQYAASAVFADSAKDRAVLSMYEVETEEPTATILGQVVLVAETANERANCEVRKANIEGWPKDALVADLNAKAKARARITDASDQRAACGFYGLNTAETSYWQIKQGHAWFFQLAQEEPDFDPRSITLLQKGEGGAWAQAVAEPITRE